MRKPNWQPITERTPEQLKEYYRPIVEKRYATHRENKRPIFYPKTADRFWQWSAHRMVKEAIKVGILPPLDAGTYACVDCGSIATVYEHRDYSRPLDVEPVCQSCNCKRGSAKWPSAADYNFKLIKQDH